MHTDTWTRRLIVGGLAVLIAALAGCSGSKSSSANPTTLVPTGAASSAQSAYNSLKANPTVSSDLNASEQQLLHNLQANWNSAHPVKSVTTAVQLTYPHGSTGKIVAYALKTFTPGVAHPLHGANPARDTWLQSIDAYARSLGANAVTPTPSP
jgi:hypothetical protein